MEGWGSSTLVHVNTTKFSSTTTKRKKTKLT